MTQKRKKKSWTGWTNKNWDICSGFSGYEFILPDVSKVVSRNAVKVRITVEELNQSSRRGVK